MSFRHRTVASFFLLATCLWVHVAAAQVTAGKSAQDLDHLVQERNYLALQRELPSAELGSNDRLYFEGILADRLNRPAEAIADLQMVLPELRKNNVHRAALAIFAIANDDFLVGKYAEATALSTELLKNFPHEFSAADLQGIKDNRNTIALLGNAPPQTISGGRNFTVEARRDGIGDLDIPVEIGETKAWWIFDTGANVSAISRSTAARLGLAVSKGKAETQSGATGKEVPLSTAVIPEVKFGEAVIHNLVVLVMDDKALDIDLGKNGHYAIQGVLGFPAQVALGAFRVEGNQMAVSPEAPHSSRSTPMFVDEFTPMIAAQYAGDDLLFMFDSGNGGAELTAKFRDKFPRDFASLPVEQAVFGGAGGLKKIPVYHLPELQLKIGTAAAAFHHITVVSRNRGVEPLDELYGNLGQALLTQFRSYTIDYTRMELSVGEPAAQRNNATTQ